LFLEFQVVPLLEKRMMMRRRRRKRRSKRYSSPMQ